VKTPLIEEDMMLFMVLLEEFRNSFCCGIIYLRGIETRLVSNGKPDCCWGGHF
jgi:hypothetical protein